MANKPNRLYILGGPRDAVSFGPNCIVADIEDERYMWDCGVGMTSASKNNERGYGPDFSAINDGKKIDFGAFTHFHTDHVGFVPALEGLGFTNGNTTYYSSPQTRAIYNEMSYDTLSKTTVDEAGYDFIEWAASVGRFKNIEKPGEFKMGKLKVWAIPNGHTPGSTSFIVELPSGRKALIHSDTCRHNQAAVKGAPPPSSWPVIPDEVWCTDLTDGPNNNTEGEEEPETYFQKIEKLITAVKKWYTEGKTVVVMAFSTGKGQNLIVEFAKAGIPAYVDGAIKRYYEIMRNNRWSELDEELPILGDEIGVKEVRNRRHRMELMADPGPKVIITPGGMGDFGPVTNYLEYGLSRENYVFCPTSWLAPSSNAQRLCDLVQKYPSWEKEPDKRKFVLKIRDDREDKEGNRAKDGIRKVAIPVVKAHVERFRLSSHGTFADNLLTFSEIVAVREAIYGPERKLLDRIVMTHGTFESMSKAAPALARFSKNMIPGLPGTTLEIF